jgi:hypothetical protein
MVEKRMIKVEVLRQKEQASDLTRIFIMNDFCQHSSTVHTE